MVMKGTRFAGGDGGRPDAVGAEEGRVGGWVERVLDVASDGDGSGAVDGGAGGVVGVGDGGGALGLAGGCGAPGPVAETGGSGSGRDEGLPGGAGKSDVGVHLGGGGAHDDVGYDGGAFTTDVEGCGTPSATALALILSGAGSHGQASVAARQFPDSR